MEGSVSGGKCKWREVKCREVSVYGSVSGGKCQYKWREVSV